MSLNTSDSEEESIWSQDPDKSPPVSAASAGTSLHGSETNAVKASASSSGGSTLFGAGAWGGGRASQAWSMGTKNNIIHVLSHDAVVLCTHHTGTQLAQELDQESDQDISTILKKQGHEMTCEDIAILQKHRQNEERVKGIEVAYKLDDKTLGQFQSKLTERFTQALHQTMIEVIIKASPTRLKVSQEHPSEVCNFILDSDEIRGNMHDSSVDATKIALATMTSKETIAKLLKNAKDNDGRWCGMCCGSV